MGSREKGRPVPWLVGTLGVVLVLTGCAGIPGTGPNAAIVTQVDCEIAGTAGRIPIDFEPVGVVLCDEFGAVGLWPGRGTRHLEGDMAPLTEALNQPDDPRWHGPCTAHMVVVPQLWLVDVTGRAARVAYPKDGCGQPKTESVLAALALLSDTTSSVDRQGLTESKAAVAAGCSNRWTPLRIAGPDGLQQIPGLEIRESIPPAGPGEIPTVPVPPLALPLAEQLDGMRLCHYAADASVDDEFLLGTFTSGSTLSAEEGRTILAAADYEVMPLIDCLRPATAFVIAHPIVDGQDTGGPITIELDGCKRLFGTTGFTLASAELLALIDPR